MSTSERHVQRIGSLVGGRYRLEGVLGEGGMAVVYGAIDEETGRRVAVKRLHQMFGGRDGQAYARFEREVRAMCRIVSPYVVEILDAGHDDDGPYLVMEHLSGESLADRLDEGGRLSPRAVIALGEQVLAAVAAAHRSGVIHRDLKPDNVQLTRTADGREMVKLLDFGISRVEGERSLTKDGQVVGTAQYLAPEQIQKSKLTHRVDLWATGVLLYRCLTGRCPFDADSAIGLYSAILLAPVPPLEQVDARTAAAFDPFFRRALAKEPEDRYGSAEEMRAALLALQHALPAPAPAPAPASARAAAAPVRAQAARRGRPPIRPLHALAVVALAATVGGIVGTTTAQPPATFALDVVPSTAEVTRDGVVLTDREHVPVHPRTMLRVAAPGFAPREVLPPDRLGARLIVELSPRTMAAPSAAPTPAPSPAPTPPPSPPRQPAAGARAAAVATATEPIPPPLPAAPDPSIAEAEPAAEAVTPTPEPRDEQPATASPPSNAHGRAPSPRAATRTSTPAPPSTPSPARASTPAKGGDVKPIAVPPY